MRYVIYGAGAIGGVIGARLREHGREVALIARGTHLEALQREGLTLHSPAGTLTQRIPAVEGPSEIEWRGDEVVVLTMKSQDTWSALEALRAAAGDVPVVCAQNGVANERMAARLFSRVYAMLVMLPATHLEGGVVVLHAGTPSGVLDVGRYPQGVDALIEEVCGDLEASGFVAAADPRVLRLKYAKLLQNVGGAVDALTEARTGQRRLVAALTAEAIACYDAAGLDYLTFPELDEHRGALVGRGEVEGRPREGSSTWQSLARATGSIETDFLNGEIVLLGTLHGVPTPCNRLLQQVAAEAARSGRPPGGHRADELLERAAAAG